MYNILLKSATEGYKKGGPGDLLYRLDTPNALEGRFLVEVAANNAFCA